MRVTAFTDEGEMVMLPSVDKCVEQFHTIGELANEKGILGKSNSVIDFRTLESGNKASNSYWESPESYRRYTLPRGFKPNFAAFCSATKQEQQEQQHQVDDLPALEIPLSSSLSSLTSMTSSLCSVSSIDSDDELSRQGSVINFGLKITCNEPRVQESLGDLRIRDIFPELKESISLKNMNLRELYVEPIVTQSPSITNFNMKELFVPEIDVGKSLRDFHLRLLFKEPNNEVSEFNDVTSGLHLDRLFKEQKSSFQNKMKKLFKKTIIRPMKNIHLAFSRLNCLVGRDQ